MKAYCFEHPAWVNSLKDVSMDSADRKHPSPIFDAIVLCGSGNATSNSRDRCWEYDVGTRDPDVVSELRAKLIFLYQNGTDITHERLEGWVHAQEGKAKTKS